MIIIYLAMWLLGMLITLALMPIIKRAVMKFIPLIKRWLKAELNAIKKAYAVLTLAATLKFEEITSFWTSVWRNGYGFYASEDTS